MEEDDLVRMVVILLFASGVVGWIVTGFITTVAGVWSAGERNVVLTQVGPWVWGDSTWNDGRQIYRGVIYFGFLRLKRYDFGPTHLTSMGFSVEQAHAMEGVNTGHFLMRRKGNVLKGSFHGRKFTFEGNKVEGVTHVLPQPREWTLVR